MVSSGSHKTVILQNVFLYYIIEVSSLPIFSMSKAPSRPQI